MKLVVIESPFAHEKDDAERFVNVMMYLRACLHDCLMRGEAPYASGYVCPSLATDDFRDLAGSHREAPRDLGSRSPRGMKSPDLPDLGFSEYRVVMTLAGIAAFFLDHVAHVRRVVAQEEMIGPDAQAVVAMVADEEAGVDGPTVEFPGQSVRENPRSIAAVDITVAVSCRPGPSPTVSAFNYTRPELLLDRATIRYCAKVVRSHARRVPTGMFDRMILGDGSEGDLPAHMMSEHWCSPARGTNSASAIGADAGIPDPARLCFGDLRPESLFDRHIGIIHTLSIRSRGINGETPCGVS